MEANLLSVCPVHTSELSVLEERLNFFVRECVYLKGVSIDSGVNSDVSYLVLSALTQEANPGRAFTLKYAQAFPLPQ
eukprot:scaffold954_cov173-Ochromonas_danica.AAC.16